MTLHNCTGASGRFLVVPFLESEVCQSVHDWEEIYTFAPLIRLVNDDDTLCNRLLFIEDNAKCADYAILLHNCTKYDRIGWSSDRMVALKALRNLHPVQILS